LLCNSSSPPHVHEGENRSLSKLKVRQIRTRDPTAIPKCVVNRFRKAIHESSDCGLLTREKTAQYAVALATHATVYVQCTYFIYVHSRENIYSVLYVILYQMQFSIDYIMHFMCRVFDSQIFRLISNTLFSQHNPRYHWCTRYLTPDGKTICNSDYTNDRIGRRVLSTSALRDGPTKTEQRNLFKRKPHHHLLRASAHNNNRPREMYTLGKSFIMVCVLGGNRGKFKDSVCVCGAIDRMESFQSSVDMFTE
jgi:hypothetical protein